MKTVKIYFVDFWDGFDPNNNFFTRLLSVKYDLVIDPVSPDYVFYSCFSFNLLDHYSWNDLDTLSSKSVSSDLVNRKFCNFVYSNKKNADPIRDKFFFELSKYKKVV